MKKKEARETFEKIRKEYEEIPYPKYLNANLDDLQKKYDLLREMEEFLSDDFTYAKLINSFSQTIKRLTRKGTKINTSERGMNKAIRPFIKKGNQEFAPYEWESDKSGQLCTITNGYWDARNYMVMDVVGHLYLLKEGGDRLPETTSPIFSDYDSIREREQEIGSVNLGRRNDAPIIITEQDLTMLRDQKQRYVRFTDHHFREFTSLDLCSNDIFDLLHRTSRVEFQISYPIRMGSGKDMSQKWYLMNVFSRPFEFGYIDKDVRRDGIVQSRIYYAIFSTILGEMFLHNLMTKNYDWISNNLYHLPQSAQIFYRHFLLHHTLREQQLNLSNIVEKMNFQDKNITNLIANLEINTLNPLVKEGMVISYEKTEGLNGIKYIINLPKKGEHLNGKTVSLQQTDTTCISEGDVGSGK